jgi:ABC-type phosphate/phosphonate transport system substrate-binding protein
MGYVLFSNYESQVEALIEGFIDVAWNTNLA